MDHSPVHQSAGDFVHGVEEDWVGGYVCPWEEHQPYRVWHRKPPPYAAESSRVAVLQSKVAPYCQAEHTYLTEK